MKRHHSLISDACSIHLRNRGLRGPHRAWPNRPAGGFFRVAFPKLQARRTGVRGETYAYWYLRRHGYVLVARNFTSPGMKGEIDMVGYDGPVLAFVEVKTRSATLASPAGRRPKKP